MSDSNNGNGNQGNWSSRDMGVLWKKTAQKTKQEYYTGHVIVDGKKKDVVVFTNKNKTSKDSPDLKVYASNKNNSSQQTQVAESSNSSSSEEDVL